MISGFRYYTASSGIDPEERSSHPIPVQKFNSVLIPVFYEKLKSNPDSNYHRSALWDKTLRIRAEQ
jgi:hypothetical protein